MRLKVGVPYAKHGRVSDPTLKSLRDLGQCKDFEVEIVAQQGSNVPRARNAMINGEKSNLVNQRLAGFDWFLCVDADTGFTVDNVRQLLAHDLDIVSGAYPHKHDANRIVAGWFGDIEGFSPMDMRVTPDRTGLFEVDWAGAGFLLIRREVFERTPYPWFSCKEVQFETEEGPCAQLISEDLGFCIKMRKNGEKIMLDADCRVLHVPHPNEGSLIPSLGDALNDLLRSRETIIRHVNTLGAENRKLKDLLQKKHDS